MFCKNACFQLAKGGAERQCPWDIYFYFFIKLYNHISVQGLHVFVIFMPIAYNVPDPFYQFRVEHELLCPPQTAQRESPSNRRPKAVAARTVAEAATSDTTSTVETVTISVPNYAVPSTTVAAATETGATATVPSPSAPIIHRRWMLQVPLHLSLLSLLPWKLSQLHPQQPPGTPQWVLTLTASNRSQSVGCQTSSLDTVTVDAATHTEFLSAELTHHHVIHVLPAHPPDIRKKSFFWRFWKLLSNR